MTYAEADKRLMELIKQRDEILLEIESLKINPVLHKCYSCQHFRLGKCSLNGKVPPEKIQENGCECFKADSDYIPF